jgi:U4/U6.U5 tri-snRNP component SNU23
MLKDSTSYLDHINGKKHQRALGFSMRVERADVTQVKDRISSLKRRIEEQKSRPQKSASDSYEERLAASVAEEEARKKRRKDEKKKLEEIQDDEAEAVDPEIAAMMGFGGFGGGK